MYREKSSGIGSEGRRDGPQASAEPDEGGASPSLLYEVRESFVITSKDGKNDLGKFKEFKLTLWRINKFKQSRHVLAQQYLTILGEPDLQVLLDRFSFTFDLEYIFLTFYKPLKDALSRKDVLFKTVVLESMTLKIVKDMEFCYFRNGEKAQEASPSLKGKQSTFIELSHIF